MLGELETVHSIGEGSRLVVHEEEEEEVLIYSTEALALMAEVLEQLVALYSEPEEVNLLLLVGESLTALMRLKEGLNWLNLPLLSLMTQVEMVLMLEIVVISHQSLADL